ncbi:MAG TPA: phosphatidate cytidylyltransferase [Thermoanaerobaculia bacterium]|jgi:phosphatidate cytidylyltransferase|nr:phosphatidate cytidylyltransferase [Thermoanaerobaculia bacterium]
MRRLLTAAVGVPLALLATFGLPPEGFFFFVLALLLLGSIEYVRLLRPQAPSAPLWLVPVALPAAAGAAFWALAPGHRGTLETWLLFGCLLLTVGVGVLLLVLRTPPAEATPALGIVVFGIPYFALPVATLVTLQRLDPWLAFLLYSIVWLGDTAAFYCGSAWGRHKMAPVVSPNKSWEGAAAGFATGIFATLVWSLLRLGEVRWPLLLVAAATAVAAQLGDLFESLLKRGVHAKDSGHLLPGHGGFFDRMDALLFAAPVMLAGLWLIAHDGVSL